MENLLTRNSKLSKASVYTVNFGIPALKTCPMADKCKAYCYATKGAYAWPVVKAAYERRFQATKQEDFDVRIVEEIARRPLIEAVRIHDAGDFYNKEYLFAWMRIANTMPERTFYFYTKRVSMVKDQHIFMPKNLIPIYSIGGTEDRHIRTDKDRHSKIFDSLEALEAEGYVNATEDDTVAWQSTNNKIGLVIH